MASAAAHAGQSQYFAPAALCMPCLRQAGESHDEYPEIEDDDKITVEPGKINIGFIQQSNLEEWQVIQSESFYMAFSSSGEYNYNSLDAFGEIERQKELFNRMIEAPMDIIFLSWCNMAGSNGSKHHGQGIELR